MYTPRHIRRARIVPNSAHACSLQPGETTMTLSDNLKEMFPELSDDKRAELLALLEEARACSTATNPAIHQWLGVRDYREPELLTREDLIELDEIARLSRIKAETDSLNFILSQMPQYRPLEYDSFSKMLSSYEKKPSFEENSPILPYTDL